MKDLEKIKSEDLGCQVQDANPGNFAIEQEVAALVGATVPAPTEPSADDARELGAQLLVFLRRALLPIRSVLRTAVAAIYAHLDSRCTDYTPAAYASFQDPATVPPYDPMRPLTPRTLPNLLTALTAFSARKISNGSAENDNIPDGISLVRLLGIGQFTRIEDDTDPWVLTKDISSVWNAATNLKYFQANISETGVAILRNHPSVEEIYMPFLKKFHSPSNTESRGFAGCTALKILNMPLLEVMDGTYSQIGSCRSLVDLRMPKLKTLNNYYGTFSGCVSLEHIYLPSLETIYGYYTFQGLSNLKSLRMPKLHTLSGHSWFGGNTSLILLELGGTNSYNLSGWSPTNALDASRNDLVEDPTAHPDWTNLDQFLQNFREHIALRLTANGTGKTLTLSQEVRNAIHAAESTYGIENIIVTQKGWTISPAPN